MELRIVGTLESKMIFQHIVKYKNIPKKKKNKQEFAVLKLIRAWVSVQRSQEQRR